MPTPCSHLTKAGKPCRAYAVHGTDPPACPSHAGLAKGAGAPPGNRNRQTHGFYAADPDAVTINDAIAGLTDKMNRLDQVIATEDATAENFLAIFRLYVESSSRLARMLRDRRALSGEAADGISAALGQALDELATEWGIDI